jgi:hypothetical protein
MAGGLDVSNDRQDVSCELGCLRPTGHAHALYGAGRVRRTQPLSARLGGRQGRLGCSHGIESIVRARYSFMPAKAALRSHKARAARSSNAAADGVVGRHLWKYFPVILATSGEDAR